MTCLLLVGRRPPVTHVAEERLGDGVPIHRLTAKHQGKLFLVAIQPLGEQRLAGLPDGNAGVFLHVVQDLRDCPLNRRRARYPPGDRDGSGLP